MIPQRTSQRLFWTWLFFLVLIACLFSAAPKIDLFVSQLFFSGSFERANEPHWEVLRQAIWRLTLFVCLLSLLGLIAALYNRVLLGVPTRIWGFILSLYLLGPGLIVNVVLKSHWGRARPAEVGAFGRSAEFTRALEPADQCVKNCSFVSGEAAGAVALAISLTMLARLIHGPITRSAVIQVGIALAVIGSVLRIAMGRHFLSDVLFSVLIVTGLALLLVRVFHLREVIQ